MKRIFLITLVSMLLLVLAAPAWACRMELSLIGDPYLSNSWSQEFEYYNDNWSYDTIELFLNMSSSDHFENDGFRDFTDSSWSGSLLNEGNKYALASGDYPYSLYYTVDFAGDMSDPLSLDMIVWLGGVSGTLVSFHQLSWDGSEWSVFSTRGATSGIDSESYEAARIPEPSTMLLLGAGLIGVGFLRRKFKR